MRGLAQSLARDLGPKGVHVAWINIDGSIDIPGRKVGNCTSEDMLDPDAIAETVASPISIAVRGRWNGASVQGEFWQRTPLR